MALPLVGLAVAAFAVSALAVPLVRRWALKVGFLDRPGERKVHTEPVPYGGGIAVFASVLAVLTAVLAGIALAPQWAPAAVRPHLAGALSRLPEAAVMMGGGLAMLLLGLADDRRGLSPGVKLAVQLAVGAAFALGVEPVSVFLGAGPAARAAQVVLTALWIAGVANVFNFIDHMDGICAGVAVIVAAAFAAVAAQTGQIFLMAMLLILMGACAGFLIHNIHPAKIFLGDAGSLFIGYLLGALTTVFTFYVQGHYPLYRYFAPLAILAVPLCDAAAVVGIRIVNGRPIWMGDRNHLAHRLLAMGMTPRGAAATVYFLTLISAAAAVLLYLVDSDLAAGLVLLMVGAIFVLMRLIERGGRARQES